MEPTHLEQPEKEAAQHPEDWLRAMHAMAMKQAPNQVHEAPKRRLGLLARIWRHFLEAGQRDDPALDAAIEDLDKRGGIW